MSTVQDLVHPKVIAPPGGREETAVPAAHAPPAAPERVILRVGAAAIVAGTLGGIIVSAFHGGVDAGNLPAVLPEYAANNKWELVHLGQFLCDLLLLVGFFALYRSITTSAVADGASAALARLGMIVAVVAEGLYGVNQAVDGVANRFVAQAWVSAPEAEKAGAFRLADAVRHIEIGTSSLWVLTVGVFLVLFGLAIVFSKAYPRLLGWAAIAVGAGEVMHAVDLAYHGFANTPLTLVTSFAVSLWTIALAVVLWRKASDTKRHAQPHPKSTLAT